jgi:hypothetical protein
LLRYEAPQSQSSILVGASMRPILQCNLPVRLGSPLTQGVPFI